MPQHINTFSLIQAGFTIALACAHWSLCDTANGYWPVIAAISSLWFFLILPALIIWNVGLVIYDAFKNKPFGRSRVAYFAITLPAFLVFSNAISNGCIVTA